MLFSEVGTNLEEIEEETTLIVMEEHVSIVEGLTTEAITWHLARNAKNAEEKTTLKPYVKVVMETQIDVIQVGPDPGDLADQVQSLFYHDVHFNAINM